MPLQSNIVPSQAMEANEIKPSHIAAARLKMAIAEREGKTVPEWISDLAGRDLADPNKPVDQNPGSSGDPGHLEKPQADPGHGHAPGGGVPGEDPEDASAAKQEGIDSQEAEALAAAYHLGLSLEVKGDVEGARTAYQQVVDSGHPEYAPQAANKLGHLLQGQRDPEGAQAAYQEAINSGDPETAAVAASGLGYLLLMQGDVEGARAAYRRAIESGKPETAAMTTNNLGHLLEEQGDLEGARAAYQQAIESGQANVAAVAANNLGHLLHIQGDVEGARAAYQQAMSE